MDYGFGQWRILVFVSRVGCVCLFPFRNCIILMNLKHRALCYRHVVLPSKSSGALLLTLAGCRAAPASTEYKLTLITLKLILFFDWR